MEQQLNVMSCMKEASRNFQRSRGTVCYVCTKIRLEYHIVE